MIIVSGCPRSGTSMMMRIMRDVFGEERILGEERPQERAIPDTTSATEIQQYIADKRKEKQPEDRQKRARDMNPNGYFEMAFSVRGVFYQPQHEDLLNEIVAEEKPRVCKIVSQGLARSDPRYIDKIIYMARDPRAVAKSQERLGRDNPMDPESAPVKDGEKVLIRSVSMFNQVSVAAAHWLDNHRDIPIHIVDYDALLDDPVAMLQNLETFLGEGDFTSAANLIDPTLRRSAPEEIDGDEADFAKHIFASIRQGHWSTVKKAAKSFMEERMAKRKEVTSWGCPRLEQTVSVEMCKLCKGHLMTTVNLIQNAERKKIDWRNEPCPYECGIKDEVGLTVQQSITDNHWTALMQSGPVNL